MRGRTIAIFAIICLAILTLVVNRQISRGHSSVIVQPGNFSSSTGRYALNVSVSPKGIVDYEIVDSQSKQVVVSGNAGSTYQRWFFFWDTDGNLWVHSSDIGGCVWMLEQGKFVQSNTESQIKKIPAEVRDNLPSSLKKLWGI